MEQSEVKAAFDAAKELLGVETVTVSHGERKALVLTVPEGRAITGVKSFLDEYLTAPERRRGTARVYDLPSFVGHANRYKDEHSALFADPNPTAPRLVAVLNYHEASAAGAPRFGDHRTVYEFPLSEEWQEWIRYDGKEMQQAEFAEFIEERICDLLTPEDAGETARTLMRQLDCVFATPVQVMALSRGLQVRVNKRVTNAVNLQSGEAQVNFEEEHHDQKGEPLRVPGAFLLGIPVFRSGDLYQIAARLRYRVKGPSVTWSYSLYRTDRVFDHAFQGASKTAAEQTGLPLFVGSPE